jgi:hypothetical protein
MQRRISKHIESDSMYRAFINNKMAATSEVGSADFSGVHALRTICAINDHKYVLLVMSTIRYFPHP